MRRVEGSLGTFSNCVHSAKAAGNRLGPDSLEHLKSKPRYNNIHGTTIAAIEPKSNTVSTLPPGKAGPIDKVAADVGRR